MKNKFEMLKNKVCEMLFFLYIKGTTLKKTSLPVGPRIHLLQTLQKYDKNKSMP